MVEGASPQKGMVGVAPGASDYHGGTGQPPPETPHEDTAE